MAEFRTELPTTTVRHDLLRDCLAWIGAHYDGGDMPSAWHAAVRETLGVPYDGLITPAMFRGSIYGSVLAGFEEILALGLHFRGQLDVTGEAAAAVATWYLFMDGVRQVDLTFEQRRYAHVAAMVAGLEHWVTHTPGGLADATKSLRLFIRPGDVH